MTRVALPDLPGYIQGIKNLSPFIVQCPTCGDCYTASAWTIAAKCVPFQQRTGRAGRQCLDCWAAEGWYEGAYEHVRGGTPEEAKAMLDRAYPTRHDNRIPVEDALALITAGGGLE